MKLGLKTRLYNAEVRNRRLEMGLSQKELAKRIGYDENSAIVGQVEILMIVDQKSPVIQRLAEFFGVSVDIICPEWLSMVKVLPKKDDRQAEVTKANLEQKMYAVMALPSSVRSDQDKDIDREHMRVAISTSMSKLKPKERKVIELVMGIPDGVELSLSEAAAKLGLSRQRVGQIKLRALRKLSHPTISDYLQKFLAKGDLDQ